MRYILITTAAAAAACSSTPNRDGVIRSGPPPVPVTGTASGTVAIGGEPVRYEYWFDRNAIRQVRTTAAGILALTTSGNLLAFDRETLAPTGEAIASPPIECLTESEPMFAGAEGAIETVDPATLRTTAIAVVDGTPVWIGHYDNGRKLAVAVARRGAATSIQRFDLAGHPLGAVTITSNRPAAPSAWFLDREDRLWYGIDAGEWGGAVGRVDLGSGAITPIEGISDGVMGFTRIDDELWAFGGITHLGMTEGFIARITGAKAAVIWRKSNFPEPTPDPRPLPVVAAWQTAAGIRVVVWNEIFDVSRDLKTWKLVATVSAQIRWGRPDSVGAYPAIRDHAIAGDDVILASGLDGLFRLRGGAVEPHAIAGQLSADVTTIALTSSGMFVPQAQASPPLRRDGDRWSPIDISALGEISDYELVGRSPWLLGEKNFDQGIVARWRAGTFERVADGRVRRSAFTIGGDDLWSIDDSKLWRFDGAWREVGTHDLEYAWSVKNIDDAGLLVIRNQHSELARVVVESPQRARLERKLGGTEVRDAIVDGTGALVATADGLRAFARGASRFTPSPLPALGDVARLARDDRGRIWQGSDRLAVVDRLSASPCGDAARPGEAGPCDPATSKLEPVAVPMLPGRRIETLVYDASTHQLLVGLGASGLLVLHMH